MYITLKDIFHFFMTFQSNLFSFHFILFLMNTCKIRLIVYAKLKFEFLKKRFCEYGLFILFFRMKSQCYFNKKQRIKQK